MSSGKTTAISSIAMRLFLLITCLCLGGCLGQSPCPYREDIKPCTCKNDVNKRAFMNCEGITSASVLRSALKSMKKLKFTSFNLAKSNIGVLAADTFAGVSIENLIIRFTNLTSLSEGLNRPPLLGLERTLQTLEIQDAFRNDNVPLTRLSLSHLKKLTVLQLEGNLMPTIGNDWFESGPYGLKELYLLDSSTAKLGSHVFSALGKLVKMGVTGGTLSEISRDMFPKPAIYLQSIDFSNNEIESIPRDMFSKMPSLKEVNFNNNALSTISEVVFSLVWSQMTLVSFQGNPLECGGGMKWIYKYRLPESLQGQCAFPEALRSRVLGKLTLSDFA